jgi:hypothetical protein
MEWKVTFHRMNAFYISLLTMKSSIAFGTVYTVNTVYTVQDRHYSVCVVAYSTE